MPIVRGVERPEEKKEEKVEKKTEEKKELTPLEEAKEVNKRKAELLDREEKLQEQKEKFEAERMVGGRAEGGVENKVKTQDEKDEEAAKAFIQEDE